MDVVFTKINDRGQIFLRADDLDISWSINQNFGPQLYVQSTSGSLYVSFPCTEAGGLLDLNAGWLYGTQKKKKGFSQIRSHNYVTDLEKKTLWRCSRMAFQLTRKSIKRKANERTVFN